MFLHEEPKELLPSCIHHWLLFCVDLWALSPVAVQDDEDSKPILRRPALPLCDLGNVYKPSNWKN